jgi:amino-acid N-acetyltransferase
VARLDGAVVGCGALHVFWEDLGEIRTVATDPRARRRGVGRAVCTEIITHAAELGLHRLFVLTFEVPFFSSLGFEPISELDLSLEAQAELRASYDRGVAEFLDLPFVKPNTLGNTRMLKHL